MRDRASHRLLTKAIIEREVGYREVEQSLFRPIIDLFHSIIGLSTPNGESKKRNER